MSYLEVRVRGQLRKDPSFPLLGWGPYIVPEYITPANLVAATLRRWRLPSRGIHVRSRDNWTRASTSLMY